MDNSTKLEVVGAVGAAVAGAVGAVLLQPLVIGAAVGLAFIVTAKRILDPERVRAKVAKAAASQR